MREILLENVVRFWVLIGSLPLVSRSEVCNSCFQACSDVYEASECDCTSATSCQGPYCFSKVEIFPSEAAVTVQKGCSSELPGNQHGCYQAGSPDSVFCFCRGNNCNSKLGILVQLFRHPIIVDNVSNVMRLEMHSVSAMGPRGPVDCSLTGRVKT